MSTFEFDQSYGRIVGVAYTSVYRRLGKYLKEKNLPITPDQFRVMTHLWQNDGCSQQELAVSSNRDKANVTRIIDILEREGIVERRDHASDRRIFAIFLTQKGLALREEASLCGQMAIQDALEGVNNADKEVCMRVLKKTIENLK